MLSILSELLKFKQFINPVCFYISITCVKLLLKGQIMAGTDIAGATLSIPTKSGAVYEAKPSGTDKVELKGPDGKTQSISIEEFKKFLLENSPQINNGPTQDTFQKSADQPAKAAA